MAGIDEDESLEYETLKSFGGTLYRGFQKSPSLCKSFHRQNLISYDVLSTYCEKLEENDRHAKNLVDALVNRVKDDPRAFSQIVEVLRQEKSNEYLAKKLEDKKEDLGRCYRRTTQTKKRASRAAASPQDSCTKKASPKSTVPTASALRPTPKMVPKSLTSPEILPKAKADKPTSDASSGQQTPTPIQQVSSGEGPVMLQGSKPLKADAFPAGYEQSNSEELQPSSKSKHSSLSEDTNPLKLLNLLEVKQCQKCQSNSSNMTELFESYKQEKEEELRKVMEECDRKVKELRDELTESKEDKRKEINKLKREHSSEIHNMKTEIKQLKAEHVYEIKVLKAERADEMKVLKTEHADVVKVLKTEHADEVKVLQAKHADDVEAFQDKIGRLKREQEERMKFPAVSELQYFDSSAITSTIASLKDTIESWEVTSQNKSSTDAKIINGGKAKSDKS